MVSFHLSITSYSDTGPNAVSFSFISITSTGYLGVQFSTHTQKPSITVINVQM